MAARAPGDAALVERARDLVHVRQKSMTEVERRRRTRSTHVRRRPLVLPRDSPPSPFAPNAAVAVAQLLLERERPRSWPPARTSCRRRVDSRCVAASSTPTVSPLGNRPISFAAPRIVVGCCGTVSPYVPASSRRAADAAAVVQTLARAVHGAAVHVEAKQSATGDEERAPLVEERLVRREIEHRRIGLRPDRSPD